MANRQIAKTANTNRRNNEYEVKKAEATQEQKPATNNTAKRQAAQTPCAFAGSPYKKPNDPKHAGTITRPESKRKHANR
jgi:hypothetical protein